MREYSGQTRKLFSSTKSSRIAGMMAYIAYIIKVIS
jgi:hypothetical protein